MRRFFVKKPWITDIVNTMNERTEPSPSEEIEILMKKPIKDGQIMIYTELVRQRHELQLLRNDMKWHIKIVGLVTGTVGAAIAFAGDYFLNLWGR